MRFVYFLIWIVVFSVFYAGFFILFQRGPAGFSSKGMKTEQAEVQKTSESNAAN